MTIHPLLPDILAYISFPLAILEADGIIAPCNATWAETLPVQPPVPGAAFAELLRKDKPFPFPE